MAQNIIIIDDNPQNIKVAKLVLSKEGYNVYSELSVKDGLKMMKIHKMSLVLMDVMMPGIDGFDGVRLIREDESLRLIPIIMVTALSTKDDVIKALKAGADDYLAKPYNIKDLVAKTKHLTNISAFIEKWCPHTSKNFNIIDLTDIDGHD
ncbi:MAG: response regulator [Sulfurimonas sp.]|jgi:DNA-binding response OmpR family regulator